MKGQSHSTMNLTRKLFFNFTESVKQLFLIELVGKDQKFSKVEFGKEK